MSSFSISIPSIRVFLPTILVLIIPACAFAQSSVLPEGAPAGDVVQRRIERARALAASHQLQQAAVELENIRATATDLSIRNVTSLMLLGIYLEEGNYGRSQSLLEEAFLTRLSQKDESIRTYFAMAGQAINGVRLHLARYRTYGINAADRNLPVEALTDLDRLRNMLERMISQAKEVGKDEGRSYDALALQEDVLGLRLSLAKDNDDRDKWQTEYASARERLASSQPQLASIGRPPALGTVTAKIPNPFATPTPAPTSTPAGTTSEPPAQAQQKEGGAGPTAATDTGGSTAEPKLISTGSLSGRESKRVSPSYPIIAKNAGVSGTVRVFAIVDENGKIWITNSEGPPMLRKAAEDAARNWVFLPTVVGGKPVRVAGYIDFDFKM